MTLIELDSHSTSLNGCHNVIVSSKGCDSSACAQFPNDSWVLDLTRPIGLLLLWTLAKTACANKVADFIAPFMKNFASKMQIINVGYLVVWLCPDPQEELTTPKESAFRKKVMKMTHRHFVHACKTFKTDFQILGGEMHQNAFGGQALPRPAVEATSLPQTP